MQSKSCIGILLMISVVSYSALTMGNALQQEKTSILQKLDAQYNQLLADPLLAKTSPQLRTALTEFITKIRRDAHLLITTMAINAFTVGHNINLVSQLLNDITNNMTVIKQEKLATAQKFDDWVSKQSFSRENKMQIIDARKGLSAQEFLQLMQLEAYNMQKQAYQDLYLLLENYQRTII